MTGWEEGLVPAGLQAENTGRAQVPLPNLSLSNEITALCPQLYVDFFWSTRVAITATVAPTTPPVTAAFE